METRVLLIEDNPGDARLILEMLEESGADEFVVDRVDRLSTALERMTAHAPDAVLLDLDLPDSSRLETFSQIYAQSPQTPIVVLTGLDNEDAGIEAVRAGAQDYLVKGMISGTALIRVLRYGIERKRAEEALRASERRYRLLFENNLAGVVRTVGDGHIVDGNLACARILGCASREELLKHQMWDFWVEEGERLAFVERLKRERSVSNLELRHRRKDGAPIWVLTSAHLNGGSSSEAAVIEGTMMDITERKRAEEERKRLIAAIEQCAETIIITDTDGKMQYVNPTFTKVSGYSREEALGANPRILKSGVHDAAFFQNFWDTLSAGHAWHGEMVNKRKDGTLYTDELHVVPVRDEQGRIVNFISNQLDVSERKRAEAENLRLATAIEQAADGIVVTNLEGRIQYVNPGFSKITGYSREEVLGRTPRILRSGKHDRAFYENMWATILAGKVWQGEITNRRKDGTLYPEDVTIAPVRNSNGVITHFIAIKQDVTERKRAEEEIRARARQQAAVADIGQRALAAGDVIAILNQVTALAAHTLDVEYSAVMELLPDGESLQMRGGFGWHEGVVGKATVPAGTESPSGSAVLTGKPVTMENLHTEAHFQPRSLVLDHHIVSGMCVLIAPSDRPWGTLTAFSTRPRAFTKDDVHFLEAVSNVLAAAIARHRDEEIILASLREKEVLLKEIHHRVKNNLQVISSLLQLRTGAIADERALEVFRESQTRIRTMALIHEKLYRSKDFSHIDFGEYVSSLVADLFQSYQVNPHEVSFAVGGDKVPLGIDSAISCALIVNELVSNCLKHAFPAREPGFEVRGSGFAEEPGLGTGDSGPAETAPPDFSSANPESRVPNPAPSASPGFSANPESRIPNPGYPADALPHGLITVAVTAGEGGKVRLVVRDNGKGFPPSVDFRHTNSLGLQIVNALTGQIGGTIQMHTNGGTEFEIEFTAQVAGSR